MSNKRRRVAGPPQAFAARRVPDSIKRKHMVRAKLTDWQYDDLITISDYWNVPISTAVYGIIAQFLADCRKTTLDLSGDAHSMRLAATIKLLAAQDPIPRVMTEEVDDATEGEERRSAPQEPARHADGADGPEE